MNLDTCRLILGFMSSSWQSHQFSKTRCPIIRLWDPPGNDHISHLRRNIIFPATFQGDMFHFLKGNYPPWRLTALPEIEFSGARRAVSLLMTGWPTLGLWKIESIRLSVGRSLTCRLRIASPSIASNRFLPLYWALAPWHRKTDEVGWPSSCDVLATRSPRFIGWYCIYNPTSWIAVQKYVFGTTLDHIRSCCMMDMASPWEVDVTSRSELIIIHCHATGVHKIAKVF